MNKSAARQEMNELNKEWLSLQSQAKALDTTIKSKLQGNVADVEADRVVLDSLYARMDGVCRHRETIARQAGFYLKIDPAGNVSIFEDTGEEVL